MGADNIQSWLPVLDKPGALLAPQSNGLLRGHTEYPVVVFFPYLELREGGCAMHTMDEVRVRPAGASRKA